jgi:hypothetical protein
MVAQFNAWVWGRSLASIPGSNPAWVNEYVLCVYCVGSEICDGPIPRPEDYYHVCVCVCVCVFLCVTECDQYNNNPLHLPWVGRKGYTKKEERITAYNTDVCIWITRRLTWRKKTLQLK